MPAVSVIIPAFRPQNFEALKRSFAGNRDVDAEWIVVDDGSGAEYDAVFADLPEGMRVLRQAENRRQGAARNVGLAAARGDWIKFLDADDELDEGHIAALLAAAQDRSAIPFAPTKHVFANGTALVNDSWRGLPLDVSAQYRRNLVRPFLSHCGALFPRGLLQEIGGYDEDLITDEDGDLLLRLLHLGYRFRPVEHVHYLYFHHENRPRVSADDDIRKMRARVRTCDKTLARFDGTPPPDFAEAIAQRMDRIAMSYWAAYPAEARALLARARALSPGYIPDMRPAMRLLRRVGGPALALAAQSAHRHLRGRPKGGDPGMKLLAISEHYFPRLGGTVNYVHETLSALAARGVEVELLVPGPAPAGWRPDGMAPPPYKVTWLDAGYPASGDPGRAQRYAFCQMVDSFAQDAATGTTPPDILHVMFGLFVMEVLDTARLRAAGLPCLATVHNVPPMECRVIRHDAPLPARLREALRLQTVAFKNRVRLKRHAYDLYVVPSQQVHDLLQGIVGNPIAVIGHGLTSDLQALMTPPASRRPEGALHLLTVGGYAPHKRQHLIPDTAERLRAAGLDFHWDVAGPATRVMGYREGILNALAARGLQDRVTLHAGVPFRDLAAFYDRAHLYVQPSIEEGFCLTALDAAAVGLPVIGCRAGALPEIIAASGGRLVDSAPGPLSAAIVELAQGHGWQEAETRAAAVRARFSWDRAADALHARYDGLCHD